MLINPFKKFTFNPNLRTLLVLPFVLQIIAGVGIVGYLSYKNGQKALRQITLELRHEIGTRIEEHLSNYLQTGHQLNQINEDAILLNELDINNLEKIGRYFAYEYKWIKGINLVAFGAEVNGSYVEVLKDSNGELRLTIIDNNKDGILKSYKVNNQGEILKLINQENNHNYDPRQRPWYQEAIAAGKPQWSHIYRTKFDEQLVIAASKPLYNQDGKLLGVLTNNTTLNKLSIFLNELKIGKTGTAFILNPDGLLIADSIKADLNEDPYDDMALLKPAIESDNIYLRKVAEVIFSESLNLHKIRTLREYEVKVNNNKLLVEVIPYQNAQGIDWLIVIMIPESDFMELIKQNTYTTIILSIIALILVLISGLITSSLIINPIIKLKNASQKIADGELNQRIPVQNIQELDALANSFNHMSEILTFSFNNLRESLQDVSNLKDAINQSAIVTLTDLEGNIIHGNDKLMEISGYSWDELEGQKTNKFKSGYHHHRFYQKMWATISKGKVWRGEIKNKSKNNQYYWVDATIVPLMDENGQPKQYLAIQTEISDRKELELNLENKVKQRTAELAQANQSITELNRQLCSENMLMSGKLKMLHEMQQLILPKTEEFKQIQALDIAGYMESADEVGGDYYDVIEQDGIITLTIGDVTGHGLESGMLMLMTQTAVRTLKQQGESNPIRFLDTLNRVIYNNVQRMKSDKNLTLNILNYYHNKVCISGQHEQIILVRKGGEIELIDTIDLGLPLGIDEDINDFIAHETIELNSGDGIVLYTDGITEARNMDKQFYEMERLCNVISKKWHKTAEEIKDAVIDDLKQYIGLQKIFDDITLLVVKQK